jgi:hypothetical protein
VQLSQQHARGHVREEQAVQLSQQHARGHVREEQAVQLSQQHAKGASCAKACWNKSLDDVYVLWPELHMR